MAIAFGSLGYARHLREHGVPQQQAEAMADAARTHILGELVTREDLRVALENLELRLDNLDQRLTGRVEGLALKLTVRLGAMMGAAVGILGTMVAIF